MSAIGWVIYNGNLPGNKFLDYAEMIRDAALRKNEQIYIRKNNELLGVLSDSLDLLQKENNELPDYVVFADKDIYLARQLELLGIPVFNRSSAIEISDDKIATYQYLVKENLPIPKTIIAPKIFLTGSIDRELLQSVVHQLGLPLIVKEAFGSFGEQVYLVHTMEELTKQVEKIQGKPFLFQEFIKESHGKDLRLQVVGDRVVAAMKRISLHDFRANVTAGGRMEVYTPTKMEEEIAIKATKAIGADFAGVDLLFGPDGSRLICEVNSNAHIRNMLDCTNINAADFIVDYILHHRRKDKERC